MKLRRAVALLTLSVVVGTLASLGSQLLIARYLHRLTGQLDSNLQSVRAAEEIQLNLLWHARYASQSSPASDRQLAEAASEAQSRVKQWYSVALLYVSSDDERAVLERLAAELAAYFHAPAGPAATAPPTPDRDTEAGEPFQRAYDEAEELLRINVDQAGDATREAKTLDSIATSIAAAMAIILTAGAIALIIGSRVTIYRPLVSLGEGIRRYASMDYAARVPEQGAIEIREIARSFNGMAAAIERQRESQLSFVAAVAHDLRTPLGAMKLAVGAMASVDVRESGPRLVAMMSRQIDLLVGMVSDLLDKACVEAGQFNIAPKPCDARDLVRHVVDLFRTASPIHKLVADVPDTVLPVHCDPARMEQVMTNLMSNAIKYSPQGGSIEVRASMEHDFICIEISDQGPGIALEDRETIFEPFRRMSGRSGEIQGVGLGLSVCRRIVERHGGKIGVTSTVGRGSTFSVKLPSRSSD